MYSILVIVRYLTSLSILLIIATLVFVPQLQNVEAAFVLDGLSSSIGIALSSTCVTMISNNFTTTCPTYEELIPLDSSDRKITGDFIYEDGYWQRENPILQNHYRFYDLEKDWIYFIDPPGDMRDRIPMIIIESKLPTYMLSSLSFVSSPGNNNTLTYGIERYVDDRCRNIVIGSSDWKKLLPDTINYLRSDCDSSSTFYKTTFTEQLETTYQDVSTSQKYKDDQRLKFIKENCLKTYGACASAENIVTGDTGFGSGGNEIVEIEIELCKPTETYVMLNGTGYCFGELNQVTVSGINNYEVVVSDQLVFNDQFIFNDEDEVEVLVLSPGTLSPGATAKIVGLDITFECPTKIVNNTRVSDYTYVIIDGTGYCTK